MAIQNDRIRERINEMGFSLSQLSALTNIPKSTLHRYVNGERENIPISAIEALSSALNISPIFIVGWENRVETIICGRWEFVRQDENDIPIYRCTNCKTKRYGAPPYCSHCGARMKGEK